MDGWSACDMKAHHHNGVRHDARKKIKLRALWRQLYSARCTRAPHKQKRMQVILGHQHTSRIAGGVPAAYFLYHNVAEITTRNLFMRLSNSIHLA